jgi:hypothetical protein
VLVEQTLEWEPPQESPSASSAAEPGDLKDGRKSQATILVELAEKAEVTLWHDPEYHPWATIPIDDHLEHWPLGSGGFRRWLRRLFYENEGKTPGSQAVQHALGVLEGQALFDGPEHPV